MISTLLNETTDEKLKDKIKQFQKERRALATFIQDSQSKKVIEKQKEVVDVLFKSLSTEVNIFEQDNNLQSIDYHDIAKYLKENELYLDYFSTVQDSYLFSLDHKGNVTFDKVDNQILILLKQLRTDIKNNTYNKNSKNLETKLYKLLLNPIKKQLVTKNSLIISTDGILRLLPFEVLRNQETQKYLIEEKNIRYIPSGKEFVRLHKYIKNESTRSSEVIVFANPNFYKAKEGNRGIPEFYKDMNISSLDGTKEEAKAIKKILPNVEVFEQEYASEVNLLKVKQPKILHIATHGFFDNDTTIQNPMLNSGIVLSEAKKSRKKSKLYGFVTALKISGLDLKGTELVVLSACDTGLANINGTDSISGLGKAFIQAGAKDVVMSLWKVDDNMTKELMVDFYKNIKNGLKYNEALKEAKLKMIKENKSPYYWAGFILNGL